MATVGYLKSSNITIIKVEPSSSRRLESSLSTSSTIFTYIVQLRSANLSYESVSSSFIEAMKDDSLTKNLKAISEKYDLQTFSAVEAGTIGVTNLGGNPSTTTPTHKPSIIPSVITPTSTSNNKYNRTESIIIAILVLVSCLIIVVIISVTIVIFKSAAVVIPPQRNAEDQTGIEGNMEEIYESEDMI